MDLILAVSLTCSGCHKLMRPRETPVFLYVENHGRNFKSDFSVELPMKSR